MADETPIRSTSIRGAIQGTSMRSYIRTVDVVNRTTEPLDCMDDGLPIVVPAGYRRVPNPDAAEGEPDFTVIGAGEDGRVISLQVPYHTAERIKRQHPLMGSEDFASNDPRNTQWLIAVVQWNEDYSHIEQSDAPERFNPETLPEVAQKNRTLLKGKGRRTKVKPGASNAERSDDYVDRRNIQPVVFGRGAVQGDAL